MKVCYITHGANILAGGQLSLLGLMENVQAFGVEPILVSERDCPLIQRANEMNIKTKIIPLKKYTYPRKAVTARAYIMYPVKRIYNMCFHRRMKKFLEEEQVDIIHFNNTLLCHEWAYVARRCGIPYVWHLREFLDKDLDLITIGKRYFTTLIKNADKLIAVSGAVQRYWAAKLGRECSLVYNGVNNDKYYQTHDILTDDAVKCVLIARVAEGKGQLDAVKAIKILVDKNIKNIKLVIIGFRFWEKRKYEQIVCSYVQSNNLQEYVELREFTDDVRKAHSESDIGLVCSRAEAFGRLTIEYMLAGLLVLGADSGGTPELVEDGVTGLLFRQGDPENLAEQLEWIIRNRRKAREMALAAQVSAKEKFSVEKTAENVYKIYQQVLNR